MSSGVTEARLQDRMGGGAAEITLKRVLVAEDDRVSAEVLQKLLSERGYVVDIAGDGEEALNALKTHDYDVVMVDFHLPKLDGLEVATAFRASRDGAPSPRFIAISNDMKGLLEHAASCETFDEVVAKPFDLEDVCQIVDDAFADQDSAPETSVPLPDPPEAPRPVDVSAPVPQVADQALQPSGSPDFDFEYLNWPEDFDGDRLSARAMRASIGDGSFRAIVVNKPAKIADLRAVWRVKYLHALPIIDRSGALGFAADFDGSKFGFEDRARIDDIVTAFANRRAVLHSDFLFAEDLNDRLLTRIFMSGGTLDVRYNPNNRSFIDYNVMLDSDTVEKEAARLCAEGLLKPVFFDRLHRCDRCNSSRFNIREECPECRSPNFVEEPYLHHFKCAYQGLESDFRQGDALICPKCRQELTHFSVDYDKPGTMIQCRACNHKGSDPAVGLKCLDCGAHTDGDQANAVDVFSYELTDRAIAKLESGRDLYGSGKMSLQFAELPLELIIAINGELSGYKTKGVPFTLLDISYRNARALEVEHGSRQFDDARNLFLENLRNVLRKGDRVVRGRYYDFALLTETDVEQAREHIDEIRNEALNAIRLDLGVKIEAHGVEAFA